MFESSLHAQTLAKRACTLSAIFVAMLVTATSAFAQSSAPLRIFVGAAAGGSTDIIARVLAEKMRGLLGETIVVENKPGAASRLAMAELIKAPADGRTIMLASSALNTIAPHIYGDKTGFDPFKDVKPLSRVAADQIGIGAGLHVNATNIAEFVTWAKANPGKVAFASPGAGGSSHFTGVLLSKALGIPMTHLPYRGNAPALTDLYGGHIPFIFTALADLSEPARAGRLRLLGTAGPKRSPSTPNTPTLREQGIDIAFYSAFDMHARAGTPPAEVQRLNAALVAAIKDPEVHAKLTQIGVEPLGSSPEELSKAQEEEYKLWETVVKESGYKGE